MASVESAGALPSAQAGIFDREHTVAKAGFNRWLVPPAALCIHLCIGMAYGFSVFWLPLSRAIGVTQSQACPDMTLVQELFTTSCDWKVASLGWMYTLFFVLLGGSAAV
ncbi:MAG: MFS transporter, partial [Bradyrhizobium sp.]|nr:MFS transporter [Bradyrhizobium sp.]